MTWLLFAVAAAVIVVAGVQLARYGDVIGEKSGLGRSWIGVVLLAATTSLPELFTGFGATALAPLPDIAVGDVLGSCMFNLLILSLMDAIQPDRISARAHQGHALAIGFGLVLVATAGFGLAGTAHWPAVGWVGLPSPVLIVLYFVAMRMLFTYEQRRRSIRPLGGDHESRQCRRRPADGARPLRRGRPLRRRRGPVSARARRVAGAGDRAR